MRISDWSSDVCSSDLGGDDLAVGRNARHHGSAQVRQVTGPRQDLVDLQRARERNPPRQQARALPARRRRDRRRLDRKSVVQGKSGSVRVDLGGRGIPKKNKKSGINIVLTNKTI